MAFTTSNVGLLRATTGSRSHSRSSLALMGDLLTKQLEMRRSSHTCIGERLRHRQRLQILLPKTASEQLSRTIGTVPLSTLKATGSNDRETLIDGLDGVNTENLTILPGWTVDRAIDESIRRLEAKNVTEPDYSARYLAAASLQLPWERGIRDLQAGAISSNDLHSTRLTAEQANDLEVMLRRREAHEPIQYVLGKWDFLDYTIAIRHPLLCPRPETEELVMRIAEETNTESPMRILDVGCGTGVIGISLAKLLPGATVEAIDVEPVAIETSMENYRRVLNDQKDGIDKDSDCYKATLCSANDYTPDHPFDVVVSNPPYIPRGDMDTLTDDVTKFESDEALCGGTDGLDVIRTIIEKLPHWCNSEAVCWMEVDPSHPKMIEELLSLEGKGDTNEDETSGNELPMQKRRVRFESSHKDMFGKDRFVKLRVG
eukprot:CAMPEP_0168228186 /NCGR_PEP_ID=MMETSP0140_2-20121125/14506_1 /TAXON_ID=44445 /ORGANISM="Pseudo-nitzschia australis, Strain 10249 10 AB" /LENGTH=429 /DNA_ID=CAMNT_0008159711 /DNA_START=131 /DNA_END=1420 /DNA_ORIENTATION=-